MAKSKIQILGFMLQAIKMGESMYDIKTLEEIMHCPNTNSTLRRKREDL